MLIFGRRCSTPLSWLLDKKSYTHTNICTHPPTIEEPEDWGQRNRLPNRMGSILMHVYADVSQLTMPWVRGYYKVHVLLRIITRRLIPKHQQNPSSLGVNFDACSCKYRSINHAFGMRLLSPTSCTYLKNHKQQDIYQNINKISHPPDHYFDACACKYMLINHAFVWGYYHKVHLPTSSWVKNNNKTNPKNINKIPDPRGLMILMHAHANTG